MKRLSALFAFVLAFAVVLPAQANGHGAWRGGHGGYSHGHGHGGGWGHNWVGPVLGAALVGSAIYAVSSPSYAAPQQVVVQQHYAPPSRVAYFCPTAQQFYPNVPSCQVPWQPVNY
jgi:hypothetical protein